MTIKDEELVRNAINAQDDDPAWQAFNRILVDLETTRQNNWQLCHTIIEYHDATEAVLNFTRGYLDGGGDPRKIPEAWDDLDLQRRNKYQAMLNAAKGAANELG